MVGIDETAAHTTDLGIPEVLLEIGDAARIHNYVGVSEDENGSCGLGCQQVHPIGLPMALGGEVHVNLSGVGTQELGGAIARSVYVNEHFQLRVPGAQVQQIA